MTTSPTSQQYFATLPSHELAKALQKKVDAYYDYLSVSELYQLLLKSYAIYNGFSEDKKFCAHKIKKKDKKPFAVKINHYRNLAQRITNIVSKNTSNFEAIALNKDWQSMSQASLAKDLVNTYFSEKDGETEADTALEYAVYLGSADVEVSWDHTSGNPFGVGPDGDIINKGDVSITTYSPLDIIQEKRVKPSKRAWVILRMYVNKWEYAELYPEHREAIIGKSLDLSTAKDFKIFSTDKDESEDFIYIYKFYHKKTRSVRDGRETIFLDSKTVLADNKLNYRDIPVYNIQSAPIHKTGHGYGQTWDTLALSELYDKLTSLITTNQFTFGQPSLKANIAGKVELEQLPNGVTVYKTTHRDDLVPMNLLQTPAEIFNFLDMAESNMEKLTGMSSAMRGDPEKNIKSGNALALVANMSYEFVSKLDKSHKRLLESIATGIIENLKTNATTERIENITGKNNQVAVTTFTKNDIQNVVRVKMQVGSPIMRTLAGRVQVADNLIEKGFITDHEKYFSVLDTGRVDYTYDAEKSAELQVEAENELLKDGQLPPISIADKHNKHIIDHLKVLQNPLARQDAAVVDAVNRHILEHIKEWKEADPNLLNLLGIPPYNMPVPPPPPEGGADNAEVLEPPQERSKIKQIDDIETLKQRMPTNPLTNEPFNPNAQGV